MSRSVTTSLLVIAFLAGTAGAQCNTPPLIEPIGQGTQGTNGVPTLTSAVPLVNKPYTLSLDGGLANATGALIAGARQLAVPLPAFGATLYPDPPLSFPFLLDAQGSAPVIAVSGAPGNLCGGNVYAQGVVIDPAARGGLAFTGALRMRFGGGGGRGLAIVTLRDYAGNCPASLSNINVIDVVNMRVAQSFSINQDHIDVAVTSNGALAVATNACNSRVVVLDMTVTPPAIVGQVQVPMMAEDVDIAIERFAIITDGNNDPHVSSIDLFSGQLVNSIVLPFGVESNDASADGRYALVTSWHGEAVRRIDIATDGTISDSGVQLGFPANSGLLNIAITPRADQALVCNHKRKTIEVIDNPAGAMQLRHTVQMPASPQALVFDPNGDTAYAYLPAGASIEVLTRAPNGTWSNTANIPVPEVGFSLLSYLGVDAMAVMLDGARLVVHGPGKVVVIDTVTHQVLGTIPLIGTDTAPFSGLASLGL